jgi:hypothetical protein
MAKAVIVDDTKRFVKLIKNSNFFNSKIKFKPGKVKINETLPFRVKFINVGIESYNSRNAAPIGIAIIGVSNYVM